MSCQFHRGCKQLSPQEVVAAMESVDENKNGKLECLGCKSVCLVRGQWMRQTHHLPVYDLCHFNLKVVPGFLH